MVTHIRGPKLLRVLDMSGLKPQQLLGDLYGRPGGVLRVYVGTFAFELRIILEHQHFEMPTFWVILRCRHFGSF